LGELIAFLSGKGGTGKTSICAAVATALAQQGESVLCIDCDIGLRNLDISLGLADCGGLSFLEIMDGGYDLHQACVHPRYPNLHFLTAPVSGSAGEIDSAAFFQFLAQAREQFPYVLLDGPSGIGPGFHLAASFADRICIVIEAGPASVRDARRAGDLLELMGKTDVRLIVNRVNEKLYSAGKFTVDDIIDQSGLRLLGIVPEDTRVVLAAATEKPLLQYTKQGAAAACQRIAKRIQGFPVPISIK